MNGLIKTELWNNHEIRFVEKEPRQWWAVAVDVCKALGLNQVSRALSNLPKAGVTNSNLGVETGFKRDGSVALQEVQVNLIDEKNIYRLAFKSRKEEAEQFQDWVFDILKQLRETSGLEGFQIFRMLDKEHQKETMLKLRDGLKHPVRVDFIKANTIANKTVSTMFGYPKMVKKDSMNPNMLMQRQSVLDDTVNLMSVVDEFGIDCSVSNKIYGKYNQLS